MKPILVLAIFLFSTPALAFNLSMGSQHYAEIMEFYYKNPRSDILLPMFQAFGRSNFLGDAKKRMFVAAFFAEIVKKGKFNLEVLVQEARSLDKESRATVAWIIHLSGRPEANKLLRQVIRPEEDTLFEQIRHAPSRLTDWNPLAEEAVLNMFWAAFMATGESKWLDIIINAALGYAHGKIAPGARKAAASLYEYAPRHPLIKQRIANKIAHARGEEKVMLESILKNNG